MKRLVFATRNVHKVAEVQEILTKKHPILSLREVGYNGELPEEQQTLAGNALQKARRVRRELGANCFADDTGLEVDALDGAPGIHSARFAGEACDPEANTRELLKRMQGAARRDARFRCVIALASNGREYLFEGSVEGEILESPRGTGGFGYDAVFRPAGYEESFAEMSPELKNTISHRGMAVRELAQFLDSQH
ncbi:MAG: RdgB/HAM1 family non-canonical purine NTP pyrophosphatase [Odoribacteraceae bacterium]|nr:RdgB/HAM1 family non-canonical purine NTP pyrophosphatase [Odoribacteraceae bacterium]